MVKELIPQEVVEKRIFLIRGQKVIIDKDIAELYGVETKHLNRQVRRNLQRFPKEFMFRLNKKERDELVTICHRLSSLKHSSAMPLAFTEHGVAMLATILNSKRAVKMSIIIVKTFVKLRETISKHREIVLQLKFLQEKVDRHDKEIIAIFEVIQQLIEPPVEEKPKRRIGFHHG
jgi:phage regulator Rha-like protein